MLPEKRMNIKELFMEYKGDYIPEEIDWGDPVGREKDIFKDDAKALDPFYSSENIGYIKNLFRNCATEKEQSTSSLKTINIYVSRL